MKKDIKLIMMKLTNDLKLLIWNTEWAKPNSKREKIIKEIVKIISPDIICITEGYIETWQDFGYIISSNEDYGYKIHQGRRKVILISKTPWSNINEVGDINMPNGRFISGMTQNIDIVGVCIPWKDAHVRTGRKDKQSWEDHIDYLNGLQNILPKFDNQTLVMGDFNQRIPKKYSRQDVYDLMLNTFNDFNIETQNNIQPIDKLSIDHLCTKNTNKVVSIESISNFKNDVRLSDHFGLVINI
jgi:hypothetical protein